MPVLLIVSDTRSETRRQRLSAVLEAYGDALPLSESTYLLNTLRAPDDLRDALKEKIAFADDESLIVFNIPQPFKGGVPAKIKQWFEMVRQKLYYGRAVPRSTSRHDGRLDQRPREPGKSA